MIILIAALALQDTIPPVALQTADNAEVQNPTPDPVAAEIFRLGVQESRTEMLIDVASDGKVADCMISKSSGSDFLDRRACAIVVEHGRFAPRIDPEIGRAIAFQVRQGVVWRIED